MAANVGNADEYIAQNCIDVEDWTDSDEAKKLRIVNVANRTLTTKYPKYTIPDAAVYEFANVLATVFNDTNRLQQQGVTQFSLSGVASFQFKDASVNSAGSDVAKFIPQAALDLIGAENGVKLSKRSVAWTVV
ncbi:hypothetical protein LOZ80_14945 [Paenibacillus sp. HWE-109]|uniref:hypothetical protein n=1 Tax=Paenibacillus sp. HWE-109 TaxID=1306526 RepID=UPI001EDE1231|nr:hypothetical protein [Paenibacillus sp. HWE-109]UKS30158.1 hypothetical protein LOZ80_14945 [Paenibacillus sp. HWE-109]